MARKQSSNPGATVALGLLLTVFVAVMFFVAVGPAFTNPIYDVLLLVFGSISLFILVAGIGAVMARRAFRVVSTELVGPALLGGTARVRLVLEPKRPLAINAGKVSFTTTEFAQFVYPGSDDQEFFDHPHQWEAPLRLPERLSSRHEQVIEIPIPRDLPPTFVGKTNSLTSRWAIDIDLQRWPDLHLEEELVIEPEYAA